MTNLAFKSMCTTTSILEAHDHRYTEGLMTSSQYPTMTSGSSCTGGGARVNILLTRNTRYFSSQHGPCTSDAVERLLTIYLIDK